jgi:hypothetical protein
MLDIKAKITVSAAKKLLFLPHAIRQMNKSARMVMVAEVKEVIEQLRIIENYPEDVRGHSVLLGAEVSTGRTVHVVCAPKEDYLAVITAYVPSDEDWENGFTKRKTNM